MYVSFIKLFVRPLDILSVSPVYDSSLLLPCLVTISWYMKNDVWHFSSTGHVSITQQLQLFVAFSV